MIEKYKLLIGLIVFHIIYFSLGYLVNPYLSTGISFALGITSILVMARYARVTWDILFTGLRSEDDDNSHIGAVSIFGVAFGMFVSALFNMVWNYTGNPIEWIGTPASNYGRIIAALSFAGLFYSPSEVKEKLNPSLFLLGFAIIVIAAASFFAGSRISTSETVMALDRPQNISPFHPICPEDRPIWGSQSGIYHDENSRYRQLVIPRRCFTSVEEAVREGYREPN